jgi:hypothetical protein
MESSGERNGIQLSQATADLLIEASSSKMIRPRDYKVFVKGKGEMQTYWSRTISATSKRSRASQMNSDVATLDKTVELSESTDGSDADDEGFTFDVDGAEGMTKKERLIEWNVNVLGSLLQQIIASRGGA